MTLPRTIVFDLDGTLVDTAPDLIAALNFVLRREGLPPVPLKSARNMIGAGARKLIERGLELEGRAMSADDINRLMKDFVDYYAAHIADASRPFEGLEAALDELAAQGFRFAVCTNKLEWLSKLLLDQLGLAAVCRDLRRRHFWCRKAGSGHFTTDGSARGRAMAVGHHGRRRRPRCRRRPPRRHPRIGVEFGYTDVPIAELKPDRLIGHMRELPDAVDSLPRARCPRNRLILMCIQTDRSPH